MKTSVRILAVLAALFGALAGASGLAAQEPRERGEAGEQAAELREAMQQYFQTQLRSELSLSDAQLEHILPRVSRMEEAKTAQRRDRTEIVRGLRRGLKEGSTDTELQDLLDRLDLSEIERAEMERSNLAEIDEVLSTRQRVQLRFFVQRFRQEMQQKVRELRGERRDGRRGRRPPIDRQP